MKRCTHCGYKECEIVEADEPYHDTHWQCPQCDSTFVLFTHLGRVNPRAKGVDFDRHPDDIRDVIARIRGAIDKYENENLDAELIEYIKSQLDA